MAWIELDLSAVVCHQLCEFTGVSIAGTLDEFSAYTYYFSHPDIVMLPGQTLGVQIDLAENSPNVRAFSQSGVTEEDYNTSSNFDCSDPVNYLDVPDITTYDFAFTPETTADAIAAGEPFVLWSVRQQFTQDNSVIGMRMSLEAPQVDTRPPKARARFWGQ